MGHLEGESQSFGNISSSCLKESLFSGKQSITKNTKEKKIENLATNSKMWMGNSKYTFGKLYFSMEEYAIHTLSI